MTPGPRRFALIGDPVTHSLSPRMHRAGFAALGIEADYVLERVPASGGAVDVAGAVANSMRRLAATGGGNVTIPHKAAAASALVDATEPVRLTGACNCFWQSEDGRLAGDNTDVVGIAAVLEDLLGGRTPRDVLVLGAGGAAAAAVVAAARLRAPVVRLANRTPARATRLAAQLRRAGIPARAEPWPAAGTSDVIVNATSLGLHAEDPLPASFDRVTARLVLDLVYDSAPGRPGGGTPWTRAATERGIEAADGREVLVRQGAACYPHWFGREVPLEALRRGLAEATAPGPGGDR